MKSDGADRGSGDNESRQYLHLPVKLRRQGAKAVTIGSLETRGFNSGFFFCCCCCYSHLRTCLLILERDEGREKERERNIDVREKHSSAASCMYPDLRQNPQPKHVP